eukprot:TRINITY_DN20159_c0_g1_i2.p1 TRINITY_DN20159_c0_g1~~TRINITY_DN20159_c0_g1_i2.p1  ORF type:complete len:449 (+),score=100.75 TRINITY_DN20159_c0_g1_i2:152-1348(+)
MLRSLVGSEMCIRDRVSTQSTGVHVPSCPCPLVRERADMIPLCIITDPGQDLDDEMALIMLATLRRAGLADPRCVVANLHPSQDRAQLARGTMDVLGMEGVPVGCGSDGGDLSSGELALPGYAAAEGEPPPPGEDLLVQTLEGCATGSVTLLLISSLKDAAHLLREHEGLFLDKVGQVVVMGGAHPVTQGCPLKPDSAHNNQFDTPSAEFLYEQLQRLKVPMVIVSRKVSYACPVGTAVLEQLAEAGSVVGSHLKDRQASSIQQLWQRACGPPQSFVRKGLPDRCDKKWFCDTFCAGEWGEVDRMGPEDLIWDLVTHFQMYDTWALLACIPCLRELLFEGQAHQVDGVEHLVLENIPQHRVEMARNLLQVGYLATSELDERNLERFLELCQSNCADFP